ncbi:MAG: DUF4298 domain-containing protein [Clostridia bacterium]|nr:DUF4298 domain-containing protein [Clostridia bacterium]
MSTIPYGPQTNFSIFEDTMAEMTWQEVEAAAGRGAAVLLPVGIVEAHGPHMDLTPDFYISALYCRYLRQELCTLGCEAIIAPTVYWGVSEALAKYPGTFSVRPETMRRLLCDVLVSLARWGFRDVFIFNAHGDPVHMDTIREAAGISSRDDFRAFCLFDLESFPVEDEVPLPPMREDGYQPDYHAGAVETSQVNAFFPEKVRRELARTLPPSDTFDPLAYCGDPANFESEINVAEICSVDVRNDARRIRKLLSCDLTGIISRVQRMEGIFDALSDAFSRNPDSVKTDPGLQEQLRVLCAYYDGGQWMADYACDEQGMLPRDLKRGVLSEDGVYNLLCDIEQAARE